MSGVESKAGQNPLIAFFDRRRVSREKALESAKGYAIESGVVQTMNVLFQKLSEKSQIYPKSLHVSPSLDREKGSVWYMFLADEYGGTVWVNVYSTGTIKVEGSRLFGTSTIKKDGKKGWKQDKDRLPNALIKAIKHPYYYVTPMFGT